MSDVLGYLVRFAKEGAEVIAADIAGGGALPDGVSHVPYDVTDEAAVISTFEDLSSRWDKLDVLVNATARRRMAILEHEHEIDGRPANIERVRTIA